MERERDSAQKQESARAALAGAAPAIIGL